MMRFKALLVFAVLWPGAAASLSCLRPDAVRLYEAAVNAEEGYYIVKGEVELLEPPRPASPNQKEPAETRARITGKALGAEGFRTTFNREVRLEASCLASWCGTAKGLTGERIMALRIGGKHLALSLGPCAVFQVPAEASGEARLLECYQRGVCKLGDF